MRKAIWLAATLAITACWQPEGALPPLPSTAPAKPAAPPPPPSPHEMPAITAKYQRELRPIIERSDGCTADAFRGSRRKHLDAKATRELIEVLNTPALYTPFGNLCRCCPVTRLELQCGARVQKIAVDTTCGWIDDRALTPLGRWALAGLEKELFP